MSDVQQRLAAICERQSRLPSATGDNRRLLLEQIAADAAEMAPLVERLVEFVPVPRDVGDDTWRLGDRWYSPESTDGVGMLLTACEVHNVPVSDRLRRRASDGG